MANYLKNTKCYLVGPIEHDKSFGRDWREVAVEKLGKLGITTYNPLDRPQWMKHLEPYIPPNVSRDDALNAIEYGDLISEKFILAQQFIRHICLRYVHSCDFVLCYLPNAKTFGTTEELVVASNSKKPILTICPDNIPSLWVYDLIKNDSVFKDLSGAIDYLESINKAEVELDLLKWIFMKDYPKLKLEKQYDWI